jgi:hypothetical protein
VQVCTRAPWIRSFEPSDAANAASTEHMLSVCYIHWFLLFQCVCVCEREREREREREMTVNCEDCIGQLRDTPPWHRFGQNQFLGMLRFGSGCEMARTVASCNAAPCPHPPGRGRDRCCDNRPKCYERWRYLSRCNFQVASATGLLQHLIYICANSAFILGEVKRDIHTWCVGEKKTG